MIYQNAVKHGDARAQKTKLYRTWLGMKKRCYQKSSVSYKNYGGRGIYVCDEWLSDYIAFKRWALENGFDESKNRSEQQLDRIDNDSPYAPWNCRFADAKTQANNRRIRQYTKVEQINENMEISTWPSARSAARCLGYCRTTIITACNTGKSAYGCMWKWRKQ